jgi:methyltransferase-like protein/trans-aconitate methyltransferase
MSSATLLSYDQVPYNSGPFRQTHPCHLAVLPVLFGLEPPPVRGCRVLELGCASGANLIPMAQDLPQSEFLGIDLSAKQIRDGQSRLEDLGLANIELRHMSILDVDDSLGRFDYVICHGVYSWVPPRVQEKILRIAAENLNPQGLCYVSYNTYPGWHLRGVVRDMMQYHVAQFKDPDSKIEQARGLLNFLNKTTIPRSEAYHRLLKDEAQILNQHGDSYLFHEHLEDDNEPCYFFQFIERARQAGLQYLADTDFSTMLAERFDEATAAILRDAPLLRQEQYMDFLRNRMFRASVLCHAEVRIDRAVVARRLESTHIALSERLPLDNVKLDAPEPLSVTVGHETVNAPQPFTKAALVVLNEAWPSPVAFGELYGEVKARAEAAGQTLPTDDPAKPRAVLAGNLMTLYARGIVRAYIDPPPFVIRPGEVPQTTPLALLQAREGDCVTNRRHEYIQLADLPRAVLLQLDGRRDRAALLNWLAERIARGEFTVRREEERLVEVDEPTLRRILDNSLGVLATSALLVA